MITSVRSIFLTLILVPIIMIVSTIGYEYLNVVTITPNMTSKMNKAVYSASEYFSKETYKTSSGNIQNVVGSDGTVVSGNFYVHNTDEEIYNNIYTTPRYESFINEYKGTWKNLEELYKRNEFYIDNMVTPANMGVAYIDINTMERIAKWNMASMLLNGSDENLITKDGTQVVKVSGYEIYVGLLEIKDISYSIVRMDSPEFMEITGMDYTKLNVSPSDDSFNICVADITYEVPMHYVGVSGLAQAVTNSYRTADGSNSNGNSKVGASSFNSVPTKLFSNKDLPFNGDIKYYIIR